MTTALAEPTRSVSRLWVAWLSLVTIAVCSGFFGPISVAGSLLVRNIRVLT